MIWLTGIIGFAIGLCAGALLFRQFRSDASRIRQLEESLQAARDEHEAYRQQVNTHFNTTAELFHNLTDSYRDVYNHLASGAQSLCPENISSQLALANDNREILGDAGSAGPTIKGEQEEPSPPRDYGSMGGHLSEDYGLKPEDDAQQKSPAQTPQ